MPSHVELQKGQHENEEYSRRSSLEGEQKIQEEFNRRQSGLQEEAQEDNVDWGKLNFFSVMRIPGC